MDTMACAGRAAATSAGNVFMVSRQPDAVTMAASSLPMWSVV